MLKMMSLCPTQIFWVLCVAQNKMDTFFKNCVFLGSFFDLSVYCIHHLEKKMITAYLHSINAETLKVKKDYTYSQPA